MSAAARRRAPKKVAVSAAAATGRRFPKWVLLEHYAFRRDDDKSFPDDAEAPIRAFGTTFCGADFRIAFSLAKPPHISRLYAQLPGFPGPREANPLQLVATHRRLALLELVTRTPSQDLVQNLFILRVDEKNPGSSSLTALPPCNEPQFRRPPSDATPRFLDWMSLGLWCGGDKEDEFVVAELTLYVRTQGRTRTKARADICLLRSSFADDQLGRRRKWDTVRVPILSATADDLWKFSHWQTDAAIPFQRWLCWVDYHQGILFWDVLNPAPTISLLWFPEDKYSLASTLKTPCSGNGGVSVIDHGRFLKFAYVARHDGGLAFEEPEPSTGYTITCHTLVLGDNNNNMAWKEDYTVTSDELPEYLQHGGIPMYPQVDIVRPPVVHFLFCEFIGLAYEKMSVLSIDMSTKTVESFYLYLDGNDETFETDDKDFIAQKCLSSTPMPFLSCEFPRFCNLSRKRKDMG